MNAAPGLGGRGVLVTRPQGQARSLSDLIRAAGGRPILFPTVEIVPTAEPAVALDLLAQTWDLGIFVSRNAVEQSLKLLAGTQSPGTWPRIARLAAVGRATAAALSAGGRPPDLVPPEHFDTESLTALPDLADLAGRRVLIVRGEGGRALLGEVLSGRGALVRYAEVYRRRRPELDPQDLLRRWPTEIHLLSATSDEVLHNLVALLGEAGREQLIATPLVVISARGAETALALGFQTVRVAERAEDAALVAALLDLVSGQTPEPADDP